MTAATVGPRLSSRRSRRTLHYVALSMLTLAAVTALHVYWPGRMPLSQEASLSIGYVALGCLAFCLLIGPFNVLTGRPNPRSSDLRRDVGLWCAATSVAHVAFAIQHHFGGNVVAYFFDPASVRVSAVRRDVFGMSNWIGAAGVLVVLTLALTSSDAAIRLLGRRWKQVQRWAYVLAVLVIVHTAMFWHLEARSLAVKMLVALLALVVAVTQALGVVRFRRRAKATGA